MVQGVLRPIVTAGGRQAGGVSLGNGRTWKLFFMRGGPGRGCRFRVKRTWKLMYKSLGVGYGKCQAGSYQVGTLT